MAHIKKSEGSWILESFDTLMDLDRVLDAVENPDMVNSQVKNRWAGGSWDDTRRLVKHGDSSRYRAIVDLSEKVVSSIDLSSHVARPVSSPFGRVRVGAYLAGHPTPCIRRKPVEDDRSPVRIFVACDSSTSERASDVERYLTCVQAFALALSKVRPVELYGVTQGQPSGEPKNSGVNKWAAKLRIPLSPSDAISISLASSPLFGRRISFTLSADRLVNTWPGNVRWAGSDVEVAEKLGAVSGQDIICPSLHKSRAKRALSNPVEFVQGQVNSYLAGKGTLFDDLSNS